MSPEKGLTKFCASINVVLAIMLRSNSKRTSLERTSIIK